MNYILTQEELDKLKGGRDTIQKEIDDEVNKRIDAFLQNLQSLTVGKYRVMDIPRNFFSDLNKACQTARIGSLCNPKEWAPSDS